MNRAAEQAELGDAGDQLTRETFVFETFADDGQDLLVDELRDRVLDQPLLFVEHAAYVVKIDGIEFGGRGRRCFDRF